MFFRTKITAFSKIHTEHIMQCTVRKYNLLMLNPAVYKLTTGLWRLQHEMGTTHSGRVTKRRGRSLTSMPRFSNGPHIEREAPKTCGHIDLFLFLWLQHDPKIVLCILETHCDTWTDTVQCFLSLFLQKNILSLLVLNAIFVECAHQQF